MGGLVIGLIFVGLFVGVMCFGGLEIVILKNRNSRIDY
jgi:hypothetical protein